MKEKKVKFNYIDVIVLVIMISVMFFAYKTFKIKKIGPATVNEKVMITFYAEKEPNFSIENLKIGDEVVDELGNIHFGKIVNEPRIKDSFLPAENEYGEFKLSKVPEHSSVEIDVLSSGNITDYGLIINNQVYGKGHSMRIRAGLSIMNVRVKDIKVVK